MGDSRLALVKIWEDVDGFRKASNVGRGKPMSERATRLRSIIPKR